MESGNQLKTDSRAGAVRPAPAPPATARPACAHLLDEGGVDAYRCCLAAAVDRVAARLAGATRPFSGAGPRELAAQVGAIDLDRPLGDPAAALDELDRVYLDDAVYFHHPRYLAHLNCPVVIPAVLAEAVLTAVNSSLDTWDQSAGGTLIEQRLVGWTADRLGLGPAADGVFTSGGTQSNLQALLLAREEACLAEAKSGRQHRPDVLPRLRVFASDCAHFSVAKAAMLLGLAPDAVVAVPCDADRRLRADALAAAVGQTRAAGLVPMAVVATAGTTDFGSIDPLPAIAELCAHTGVWLHVDAAYGCGLLVSRRRALLAGIERADSVTVDFHKSFFQPVSSSALLVRDGATLRHATYHADYLNPARCAGDGIPNQVDKSLQTTRRFDALKLWLTLRVMGPDAVGELFDSVVDRAEQAWRLLAADHRFEVATRPQLSALVFRYVGQGADECPERLDAANRQARATLADSGEALVAGTVVDGRQQLKITLLNPRTSLGDVEAVLDLLADHAEAYLRGSRAAV